mmetsp:Transcript_17233/g.30993  ORF Transcript_17233/g.30993 Transcript_17233/m.30993 type:complete len:233 (-) Transcript_17233:125-823(-)|eukprot:CAMPEP_0196153740 /NCGR_PEP_ID=MMETSP0910-20130528/37728_1 /TAXON_ID=49265 /ORGANISM="Thalassiosira rotula, Strain GSO102" /LENGTH=232 /DNA_ID=CAMNT_0041417627 /DNA_START=51 /DNA_END=749 /DNA_ORIENTATION=+
MNMKSNLRTSGMPSMAATILLLLATTTNISDAAEEVLHDALIGCWDDQFNGTSSSYLMITKSSIIVSYTSYPPPIKFQILPEHSSTFYTNTVNDGKAGVSLIASNDPNDQWNAGKYSDFDFMIHANDKEWDDHILYYCQIDFNDVSATEAAKFDEEIDYTNLESGCNNFTWTKMTRTEVGCETLDTSNTDEDAEGKEGVLTMENKEESSSSSSAVMGLGVVSIVGALIASMF